MKSILILIFFNLVLNLNQMNSQNSRIPKQINDMDQAMIPQVDTILIGYAYQSKMGAFMLTSVEERYYIDNLVSWNKMYSGKKVIVSGKLEFVILRKKPKKERSNTITLQDIHFEGDSMILKRVKNAVWRLYEH
jgi:hypothetical protein